MNVNGVEYELVCGLETHVELATKTKIFCGCSTAFGGEPNTRCCPVCLGLPGALPKLNAQVVRLAAMAGLALGCEIAPVSKFDRKNYFYPDLPKAYQITQHDLPLCRDGGVTLKNGRRIRIQRIHLEEDAGKQIHGLQGGLVDYNRSGVPLIEIVTEPDFRAPEEARAYLEALQQLLRWLGVSDCKMQEGSLRCDVNISLRGPDGTDGVRTELKNLNSFAFIEKAIHYEAKRQSDLISTGQSVEHETRRYDERSGSTEAMRSKEQIQDYRYFREPDLPILRIGEAELREIRGEMPELPDKWVARWVSQGIPEPDAMLLARHRSVACYFEEAAQIAGEARWTAHLILGPLFRRAAAEAQKECFSPQVSAGELGHFTKEAKEKNVDFGRVKSAFERGLDGESTLDAVWDSNEELSVAGLESICRAVVEKSPDAARDYRAGKERALKALMGAAMRVAGGKAVPSELEAAFLRLLSE